jgi:hypothetical protein
MAMVEVSPKISVDSVRVAYPLFQTEGDGSTPVSTLQVSDLSFEPCSRRFAATLNRAWHSRLPKVCDGMFSYAFHACNANVSYAVALWSNPVARLLPQHWLELRRLACSPEMPKNGASAFLGWMVRYLRKHHRQHERLISYQDTEVHKGTIYKASGWIEANRTRKGNTWKNNVRDRQNINGDEAMASIKVRWEKVL